MSQTSAAVVAREALAAAVHAPAGGAGGGSAEGREGEGEGLLRVSMGCFEPECWPRHEGDGILLHERGGGGQTDDLGNSLSGNGVT